MTSKGELINYFIVKGSLFLAPMELKKCKLPFVRPFVRAIVQFMCYKGFKGCCKGQEQSRGAKKGPEGLIR